MRSTATIRMEFSKRPVLSTSRRIWRENDLQAGASFFTLAACQKFGAAFAAGDDAYVMSLIESGVDPNIVLRDHPSAALFGMCGHGNGEAASELLSNGADPNYASAIGTTLLHVACSNGHSAVVQVLINMNADVRALDNNLESALDHAGEVGHDDIVKILRVRMEMEKWLGIASTLPPNIALNSVEANDHLIHKESTNLVKEFPPMDVHFQVMHPFLCLSLSFHTRPS
jgi:ankyrin repeat protein